MIGFLYVFVGLYAWESHRVLFLCGLGVGVSYDREGFSSV